VLQRDLNVPSPISFAKAGEYQRQGDEQVCREAATTVEAAIARAREGEAKR
jgi:hypothetical protein